MPGLLYGTPFDYGKMTFDTVDDGRCTKYGGPLPRAEPVYRVSECNPLVDGDRTAAEVRARLEALRTALEALRVQPERDIVQEEIRRLEGLLKEADPSFQAPTQWDHLKNEG